MLNFIVQGALGGVLTLMALQLVLDLWRSFSGPVAFCTTLILMIVLCGGALLPRLCPPLPPECNGKGVGR